jgi:aldehyde:ferredoxin oxidoreductase
MYTPGQVLSINLTTRQIDVDPLPLEVLRHNLGGRGLNAHYARQHLHAGVDALSPENVLLMSCGLLTGTEMPSSARLQLAARSPLTGLLGTSNVGGHAGAALYQAGYRTVQITGQADRPVYVYISAEGVEIRDAAELWGLDLHQVAHLLDSQNGKHAYQILAIGPAGENLVRFASVNTVDGHAAGRTGMGAVMGSKRLKAVVIAQPPAGRLGSAETRAAVRDYAKRIRSSDRYDLYATYSNAAYLSWTNEIGLLGTRNFQTTQFEDFEKIDGMQLVPYVRRHKTCHRCPVHCKAEVQIAHGQYKMAMGERPDIEPVMAFGARIGVNDPEAILHMYQLTNILGLDVISVAGVLGFAAELYERGILTDDDTGGLAIAWGDAAVMIKLLHQIACREGLGDLLADGVRAAAARIGRGSEKYAYHSKGLELPGYDPRAAQGTALGFAVSNRGADYTSIYPSQEFFMGPEEGKRAYGSEESVDYHVPAGKGLLVRQAAVVSAALDALGVCKVPVLSVVSDFSLEREAALASAITGLALATADLLAIGARIVTAERRLNIAFGMTAADDTLPDHFLHDPVPSGPTAGQTVKLDQMVGDYYAAMGWDEAGNPPPEDDPPPASD